MRILPGRIRFYFLPRIMDIFDFSFETEVHSAANSFRLAVQCRSAVKRLAVVGPSGAGKTLTMQLLAGLIKPQKGFLKINGICYGDSAKNFWQPPQKRRVGLMFQDYALFPHLTVAQNIAFGRSRGIRNPPQKADADTRFWLEKMQLSAVARQYPHQISGGQRQRTALARACITRPGWLLLDEPFSAMDADLRRQMRTWVALLQQELDIPMLIISHDIEDTDALADEVVRMEKGILHKI